MAVEHRLETNALCLSPDSQPIVYFTQKTTKMFRAEPWQRALAPIALYDHLTKTRPAGQRQESGATMVPQLAASLAALLALAALVM